MRRIIPLFLAAMLLSAPAPAKEFPYKEISHGAKKGLRWGGKKSLSHAYEMFRLWSYVYWKCGNVDPGYAAIITWVESAGNPWSRTDDFSDLGEVGLISLKRATARTYDVDACDPCANVWADTLEMKRHRERITKLFPWLKKYDKWERDLWADAVREAGPGSVTQFVKATGLVKNIAKVKSPIMYVFKQLQKPDLSIVATAFGKGTAAQAAFRMFWVKGLRGVAQRFGGGGKAGREYMKRCTPDNEDRPPGLAPYPGDKQHGYCSKDMKKWGKPPTWRWKKTASGWMADQWKEFCKKGEKCAYEEIDAKWFDARQAMGMLPTDGQIEQAESEMEAAGCLPPDIAH